MNSRSNGSAPDHGFEVLEKLSKAGVQYQGTSLLVPHLTHNKTFDFVSCATPFACLVQNPFLVFRTHPLSCRQTDKKLEPDGITVRLSAPSYTSKSVENKGVTFFGIYFCFNLP
jgi:hypothetical protein